MHLNLRVRRHRQADNCPIRNIGSGIHVGNGDVATLETLKVGLRFPIASVTKATGTTGATRVSRINRDNPDTCQSRLVADGVAQLSKGPTALATALLVSNRSPLSNARQLFKCECLRPEGTRFRRLCNKAFADDVIGVFLKAPFPARELAQPALAVFGANRGCPLWAKRCRRSW